jgi:hypothetical protein
MLKVIKMKQNSKKKLSPEQSFFLILLFVIGGFTIIMLNFFLSIQEQEVNSNNNLSDLEDFANDIVLNSNLYNDFGRGLLIHEGVVEGNCSNCFIFSYKFDAKSSDDLPSSVSGFRYKISMQDDNIKLIEVFELV